MTGVFFDCIISDQEKSYNGKNMYIIEDPAN